MLITSPNPPETFSGGVKFYTGGKFSAGREYFWREREILRWQEFSAERETFGVSGNFPLMNNFPAGCDISRYSLLEREASRKRKISRIV